MHACRVRCRCPCRFLPVSLPLPFSPSTEDGGEASLADALLQLVLADAHVASMGPKLLLVAGRLDLRSQLHLLLLRVLLLLLLRLLLGLLLGLGGSCCSCRCR